MHRDDPRSLIFATDDDAPALPSAAATDVIAAYGMRGSGKTTLGAVLVENMHALGARVIVLDIMGVWWGLRAPAVPRHNGQVVSPADPNAEPQILPRGAGLPFVIFGGEHADVAITPTLAMAGKLGRLLAEGDLSAVVDVSRLPPADRAGWLVSLIAALYENNRDPLHLVLDEADYFAPLKPDRGNASLGTVVDEVVRRGRVRGFGVMLLTQRPAALATNVRSQADTVFALRLSGQHDHGALDDWMRSHGLENAPRHLVLDGLSALPVGEAWAMSRHWPKRAARVHVCPRTTLDTSATPKVGDHDRPAPALTPVRLADLVAALQDPPPGAAPVGAASTGIVDPMAADREALRDALNLRAKVEEQNALLRRIADAFFALDAGGDYAIPQTDPATLPDRIRRIDLECRGALGKTHDEPAPGLLWTTIERARHDDGADALLAGLRELGWAVAVHNDYRVDGEPHTFWLFTKDGRAIKGEGRTDVIALREVVAQTTEAAWREWYRSVGGAELDAAPDPEALLGRRSLPHASPPAPAAAPPPIPKPGPVKVRAPDAPARSRAPQKGGKLRMLSALRRSARPLTRAELGTLACMSSRGGTFVNYVSELKGEGKIRVLPDHSIELTVLGAADVPDATPMSLAEVLEAWSFGRAQGAMLAALVDADEQGCTRAELAQRGGLEVSGGTFVNYLSEIRTAGFLHEAGKRIYLAPFLRALAR